MNTQQFKKLNFIEKLDNIADTQKTIVEKLENLEKLALLGKKLPTNKDDEVFSKLLAPFKEAGKR